MKFLKELLSAVIALVFSALVLLTFLIGIKENRPDLVLATVSAILLTVIAFGFLDDFYE